MDEASQPALRILFAGTPEFAVPALERLISAGLAPVGVLTQPDRPAGRGRKLQASPVKSCARTHHLPVLQPATLRDPATASQLAAFEADLMVVAAYGLILPQDVLDLPLHGCWNIHASLLPRWRGAAPIQRAIEAGDRETGVCIMQMDAGLDTGPVYSCRSTPIAPEDTGGSLHDRLAGMGADGLLECIGQLLDRRLPQPTPQDERKATYARKVEKSEAQIDWTRPAAELERRVRAFNPWPVAWCELGGERLRVWRAAVLPGGRQLMPGQVLAATADGIDVSAGEGTLRLLEVQRSGGRRVAAADYLRARPIHPPP